MGAGVGVEACVNKGFCSYTLTLRGVSASRSPTAASVDDGSPCREGCLYLGPRGRQAEAWRVKLGAGKT